MGIKLGTMKIVNPREIWNNEERDFTPWLVENIDELSKAIGIPIQVEEREKRVGKYELDIYGKIEGTNDVVVIENQLETSDHKHLGQLITYASGLDASIIIWVTPKINDEHKQAVNWLNEISSDKTSFFLVRPEVLQIDDSYPAARFYVEVSPNDFERTLKSIVNQTDRKSHNIRIVFWSDFIDYCKKNNFSWGSNRRTTSDNWISFSVGKSGYSTSATLAKNSMLKAEITIDTGDKEENERVFDELHNYSEEISSKYHLDFVWERLENSRVSKVALYKDYDKEKLENDENYRIECCNWLTKHIIICREIFNDYLVEKSII